MLTPTETNNYIIGSRIQYTGCIQNISRVMLLTMVSTVNCRFSVLCALSNGRLQLVDLHHHEDPHIQTLKLDPPGRPTLVMVHPTSILVVAVNRSDGGWELRCMDPITGQCGTVCCE